MEFLTGLNLVIALMNVGMITYIHTSHLFTVAKDATNYRITRDDLDSDECDTSDDTSDDIKERTYFS